MKIVRGVRLCQPGLKKQSAGNDRVRAGGARAPAAAGGREGYRMVRDSGFGYSLAAVLGGEDGRRAVFFRTDRVPAGEMQRKGGRPAAARWSRETGKGLCAPRSKLGWRPPGCRSPRCGRSLGFSCAENRGVTTSGGEREWPASAPVRAAGGGWRCRRRQVAQHDSCATSLVKDIAARRTASVAVR